LTTTDAPARASATASARPMPLPAPVTTATLPSSISVSLPCPFCLRHRPGGGTLRPRIGNKFRPVQPRRASFALSPG